MTLVTPWIEYCNQLEVLFAEDNDVRVDYNTEKNDIRLYVADAEKADALAKLLPSFKTFGNVTVTVTVVPPNENGEPNKFELIAKAFKGNNAVKLITNGSNPITSDMNFVVFRKKVVQYYNDNIGDYNGVKSTLYQDLAAEIFGEMFGVHYCTDINEE